MLSCLIRSKNERAAILTIRMHYDHVDTPVFSHRGRKNPSRAASKHVNGHNAMANGNTRCFGRQKWKDVHGILPTHGTIHCINIHKLVYTNLHTCRYIFIYASSDNKVLTAAFASCSPCQCFRSWIISSQNRCKGCCGHMGHCTITKQRCLMFILCFLTHFLQ